LPHQKKASFGSLFLFFCLSGFMQMLGGLMLLLRVPDELVSRLEKLAERTGRSKKYHARQAILEYLDDQDDLALAEQIKHRIDMGEERTSSLDEVAARPGLD
jgi:RHH-type rel operon transcriptional repressor/antitoxin RelB